MTRDRDTFCYGLKDYRLQGAQHISSKSKKEIAEGLLRFAVHTLHLNVHLINNGDDGTEFGQGATYEYCDIHRRGKERKYGTMVITESDLAKGRLVIEYYSPSITECCVAQSASTFRLMFEISEDETGQVVVQQNTEKWQTSPCCDGIPYCLYSPLCVPFLLYSGGCFPCLFMSKKNYNNAYSNMIDYHLYKATRGPSRQVMADENVIMPFNQSNADPAMAASPNEMDGKARLQKAKAMLDEGLIDQADYDKIKGEVLTSYLKVAT